MYNAKDMQVQSLARTRAPARGILVGILDGFVNGV